MNLEDRRDHELAARAAGLQLVWKEGVCKGGAFCAAFIAGTETPWRPRDDDGDALRLAVACGGMELDLGRTSAVVYRGFAGLRVLEVECGDDPLSAARRVIFRSAVGLGLRMPA